MKIIIVGDGEVGYSLAENLSNEDNDVTIIDKDSEALVKASENLDVMCIQGNGISTQVLLEAGVKGADIIIAATTSDEKNMLCCLTAKRLGAVYTIARIRDPEYANELSQIMSEIEIDMVINPEQTTAREIARLIKFPPAINVDVFAKGRVEMVEIKVLDSYGIAGETLEKIPKKFPAAVLIGAIIRKGEVFISNGKSKILGGDTIYVIGEPLNVYVFCQKIGIRFEKIKNALIVGGGRIAHYLAKNLEESGIKVKLIEKNKDQCIRLADELPSSIVICGNGTDERLLRSENVSNMGAFISVTGHDEENLVAALLAREIGVQKTIARINKITNLGIIQGIGIDRVISPKNIITDYILTYVRGLKNARFNTIKAIFRIINGEAEALEFIADNTVKLLDIPLKELELAQGVLVVAIVHKNKIIIPTGKDFISEGDTVILIAKNTVIRNLDDILLKKGNENEL